VAGVKRGLPTLLTQTAGCHSDLVRERPFIVKLDPVACRSLLAQASVGRVAVSMAALPVIRTVRYALAYDHIVFRVALDSRLCRATTNVVVAFNADQCDDGARHGWSVLVQDVCHPITDHQRLNWLQSLPLIPWADTPTGDTFMSMSAANATGESVYW
jgi:hypothetical protein